MQCPQQISQGDAGLLEVGWEMGSQLGRFAGQGGPGWGGQGKLQGEEQGDKAEDPKLGRQQGEGVEEKAVDSSREQAIAKGLGWEISGLSRLMYTITLSRKLKQALEAKPAQGEVIKEQLQVNWL